MKPEEFAIKAPEEIKKRLSHKPCRKSCEDCPYTDECLRYIGYAGLALIKRLEEKLETAQARIEELETNINLMKLQMEGDCGCCKHKDDKGPCADCMGKPLRPHWEYEGLPELPKKGASE